MVSQPINPKIISFDMDGTIVTDAFDRMIWELILPKYYAQKKGISLKQAKQETYAEYERLLGINEWTSLRFWLDHFHLTVPIEELLARAKPKIKVYHDAKKLLPWLAQRYQLVLVTQAPWDFINEKSKTFSHYFSQIYSIPDDFKRLRKDKEIWQIILKKLHAKPQDIIHIGDHFSFDYLEPRKLGIFSILLNRKRKYYAEDIVQIKTLSSLKKFLNLKH